jgi:hypothetical protein
VANQCNEELVFGRRQLDELPVEDDLATGKLQCHRTVAGTTHRPGGRGHLGEGRTSFKAEELDRGVNRPEVRGCREVIDAGKRDQRGRR